MWIACPSSFQKYDIPQILFVCKNNQFVSTASCCDGIHDCGDIINPSSNTTRGSDEDMCHCQSSLEQRSSNLSEKTKFQCSPLFYMDIHQRCKSFVGQVKQKPFLQYQCGNLSISKTLVNDLIPDCGPMAEDEFLMKQILTANVQLECPQENQIPCMDGHSTCYNMSDLCVYRLESFNNLIPCRTGAHLHECSKFECNIHFKCQQYYCVPWGHTCDGKWDCPFGLDESISLHCGSTRICQSMFKCKLSQICLHHLDICDAFTDCPSHEDEQLCQLQYFKCVQHCSCLNLAIKCADNSLKTDWNALPHVAYHFVNSWVWVSSLFRNTAAVFIHLTNNSMATISFHTELSLIYLNVSENNISELTSSCFRPLKYLRVLSLKRNQIEMLGYYLFYHNLSSIYINLANNNISSLHRETFQNLKHLNVLNLQNNPLSLFPFDILTDISLGNLGTNTYKLCCVAETVSSCSEPTPWFVSCLDLLPKHSLKNMFISVFATIACLNISYILWNKLKFSRKFQLGTPNKTNNNKNGPYNLIVISGNVCVFAHGFYILFLWGSDLHYKDSFIIYEQYWRKSLPCGSAFTFSLLYGLLSPQLSFFMSLARTMVVCYPFTSDFKSSKFVVVWLSGVFFGNYFLASSFTTWILVASGIPSTICLPFADPQQALVLIKILTSCVAVLQTLSILATGAAYICLIQMLVSSQKAAGREQNVSITILLQIISLLLSNVLSWIPSGIVFTTTVFLKQYPPELIIWTVGLIVSIKCMVDPIIMKIFLQ